MANVISIGTALPQYCHPQNEILTFMQQAYKLNAEDSRKLAFLYRQSEIESRYSVINDFAIPDEEWRFAAAGDGGSTLDCRMSLFNRFALPLSIATINDCINGIIEPKQITHLITVSCTGMSAPGLDLQVAEALHLPVDIFRTSVNFMGCYAAIHALKIAKMICDGSPKANVVIVCTEICTIHFQHQYSLDNAASSLLFGDGSAAVLVSNAPTNGSGLQLKSFYSEVCYKGKNDMSWQISTKGFLMKLSAYIPQLIQEDIAALVERALLEAGIEKEEISHWCLHPGGKKILDAIQSQLSLTATDLCCSRSILKQFGNMSSPTILFVLKEMMQRVSNGPANIFGVAFGPGLTMETFLAVKE